MMIPQQLDIIDITGLQELCEKYLNTKDEDLIHYIFECAMETMYGKDVWTYLNSK